MAASQSPTPSGGKHGQSKRQGVEGMPMPTAQTPPTHPNDAALKTPIAEQMTKYKDSSENSGSSIFFLWFCESHEERNDQRGDKFKRRTFTFGFGTGNEATDVRLKAEFDTVLAWRKENEGDSTSWHEIDLNDVKIIEAKGSSSLIMSSKTGDLLLELEAADATVRDKWVEALKALLENLRLNPQARMAQKSVKDRVKEQAQRQRHVAKRTIEMQQQKKEAESRKARYLKETGGMQYTAIAMANRK